MSLENRAEKIEKVLSNKSENPVSVNCLLGFYSIDGKNISYDEYLEISENNQVILSNIIIGENYFEMLPDVENNSKLKERWEKVLEYGDPIKMQTERKYEKILAEL